MERTPIPTKNFADRLEAVEEELKSLLATPEYLQMLTNGYLDRTDCGLGEALIAVQQCFDEYYVDEVLLDPK